MYWFESRLGAGGFGTVYRVRRLHDWTVLAAKQLHPTGDDDDDDSLVNEIRALQRLRHERVVEYADWYEDSDNNQPWRTRSVLVMEYCPLGSLHDMLAAARAPFPPGATAAVLKQVAEGLAYLHGKNVTHRDLKPANILVRQREPLSLALSDFGLASLKREEDGPGMYGRCGTALYSAPEMFRNHRAYYTQAVDVWGMGVIGIELLQKGLPMPRVGIAVDDCPREITTMAAAMSRRHSWPILRIVGNMLAWDARDRPPADKCVGDIDSLLRLEPLSLAEVDSLNWTAAPSSPSGVGNVPAQSAGVRTSGLEHYLQGSVLGQLPARERSADGMEDSRRLEMPVSQMRRPEELEV
jgi:serine/threonine protein kinase